MSDERRHLHTAAPAPELVCLPRAGGQILDVHGRVSPWTTLEPLRAGYWTIVRGWEIQRWTAPPRKRTPDDARERERDWHIYVHLEVTAPARPPSQATMLEVARAEQKLAAYRAEHGRPAWVFLPLRFAVGVQTQTPRVPTNGALATFLACIGQPNRFADDILTGSCGWRLRVKVHTAAADRDGDDKPEQIRYSKASKILEARSPRP